jgi:hypothetical protein
MAGFCKTCNAPVPLNSGFCPACGSALETAAATPAAAPPKQSSNTLKIVLIVIAVVVVMGVAGVAILGYVGYRALHTAGNSFSVGKGADVSDADLGVSIYPGAVRSADGGMRMNLANNLVVSAIYTTSDSASEVVSYYQGRLGPGATSMEIGRVTSLTLATATGGGRDSVTVTVTPQTSATQIMIQHTKTQKP